MRKVAVLIDGGFFLKRLPSVRPGIDPSDAAKVAFEIKRLITAHLKAENKIARAPHARELLYRSFFYDARPFQNKAQLPCSKKTIDYAKSDEAAFRSALFQELRKTANMAVRLGEVRIERGWLLRQDVQKALLSGARAFDTLTDEDFVMSFRQKGVDMRIGVDIASLTLKRQVQTIVLVSGDSDFVTAAKLARREGVKVVLDPMWWSISPELFEHIDGLRSGLPKPDRRKQPAAAVEATP